MKDEMTRFLLTMLISGGVFWLLAMRNLAVYHDYISMYHIGTIIVLWIFLVDYMEERKIPYLKVSVAIFGLSILLNFVQGTYTASQVNWQTSEFQKVREEMKQKGWQTAYLTPDVLTHFIEGVRYGDSFLLSDFNLTYDRSLADVELLKIPSENIFQIEIRPLK